MPRRTLAPVRRAMLSLALAGLLLPAPGPVAPARADHDPRHDSVARVLVVINKITVFNDNDPESEGDITIHGWFLKVNPGCPADTSDHACRTQLIQFGLNEFGADSGETVTLDRAIPSTRDKVIDESITPMFGIPIYPGQAYRLVFVGFDQDLVFDDFLGRIELIMTEQNGWGIGMHTDRATLNKDVGNVYGSGGPGDVSIEYQIRQVPLPDLDPLAIKVAEGAGGAQDQVCVRVLNRGAMDAPPFQMALYLDGTSPPIQTREVNGLASGQYAEPCVLASLPAIGQHSLMVIVDEPRGIFEENDTNNWFAQPYAAARVAPDSHIGGLPVSPLVADPGPPSRRQPGRPGGSRHPRQRRGAGRTERLRPRQERPHRGGQERRHGGGCGLRGAGGRRRRGR